MGWEIKFSIKSQNLAGTFGPTLYIRHFSLLVFINILVLTSRDRRAEKQIARNAILISALKLVYDSYEKATLVARCFTKRALVILICKHYVRP